MPKMHWCIGVEEYKREVEEGKIAPITSDTELELEPEPKPEPEEPINNKDGKNNRKCYAYSFSIYTGNYAFLLLFIISIASVLHLLIPDYTQRFILVPELIGERPWTLVTHIFLHGSFWHFLFNMLFLLFFATVLERKVGSLRFLLIFFLTGIVAGIGWSLTAISPMVAMVGASGALYGVFGALAVLMPRMKTYIFPLPIPLEMWMMAILFVVLNFLMIGTAYPIAFTAHLSGLFFGLLAGMSLRR